MNKLAIILICLLFPITVSAQDLLDIEKGNVDLLRSEVLAKPFTIFDQLLYSLNKQAEEAVQNLRPENNDFRVARDSLKNGSVYYSQKMLRVGMLFMIFVNSIDDPWREVCRRHAQHMAIYMGIPYGPQKDSFFIDGRASAFFSAHLGPTVSGNSTLLASLKPFLDAVIISVQFNVLNDDTVAYLRRCDLDTNTNRVTYFEHKY